MKVYDSILEVALLQSMCESEHRNIILSQVELDWFTGVTHQEIFKRISLYIDQGKPIPPLGVLVCDHSISEGARAVLSNSNNVLYKETDIRNAIDSLRQYRNKKLLTATCMNCLENLNSSKPNIPNVLTVLETVLQKCYASDEEKDEVKEYSYADKEKLIREADKELSDSSLAKLIPTGFYEFDRKTGGLVRGNVLVLASVPGGGKSAMALQMALYQYIMGYSVCIVSFEMDTSEIEGRLFSNLSRINHTEINLKKLTKAKKELILTRLGEWLDNGVHGNRFGIWTPKRELSIPQITLELKSKGYDVIYIDYLSLLYQNPKKQVWENLGEHTRAAKMAGSTLNAGIVILAQYDDESNKIKYSKAIVANANFVWAWDYGDKEKETGIVEVKQLKARNSPTYPFYLDTDYSTFSLKDYRGPLPEHDDITQDDERNQLKKRKKKFDNKVIAQKTATQTQTQTLAILPKDDLVVPEADKRGIPKMPQLL